MSKLNKYRQTKEYKLSDQGGEYTVPCKGADAKPSPSLDDPVKQIMAQQIDEEMGERDLIESVKEMIADKVVKDFDDILFEMVCKEMSNNYMFRSNNYLTEAGCEMFEDQWFEFYHEHHADILAQIQNKLIY